MKKYIFFMLLCMLIVTFSFAQNSIKAQEIIDEAVIIDSIDDKAVTIKKTKYINIQGINYQLEEPFIITFENSEDGRKMLKESIRKPFVSAILTVWDDKSDLMTEKTQTLDTTVPDIKEVVTISFLNDKSVAFLKNSYITINNIEYKLGLPWGVSYQNFDTDREFLMKNKSIPQHLILAVMAVWGDAPTVATSLEQEDVII